MIIVTGGCGFIGSNLIKNLNKKKINDIFVVDSLTSLKKNNLKNLRYKKIISKKNFLEFIKIQKNIKKIKCIFHFGACSDTTNNNWEYLYENNYKYSEKLLKLSMKFNIRLIYASSASVYGLNGNNKPERSKNLKPLNKYGRSKLLFDNLVSKLKPKNVVGLRFFNVYGLNEFHKKKMISPVTKFYLDIKKKGYCNIFEEYGGYRKGLHSRDFISVETCNDVALWFKDNKKKGIYNVGTGVSVTFNSIAKNIISELKSGQINYIKFPNKLKGKYQSFTKANVSKLRRAGYNLKTKKINFYIKNFINDIKKLKLN